MEEEKYIFLDILKCSNNLNQQSVASFMFAQIIDDASLCTNTSQLMSYIDVAFGALETIQDRYSDCSDENARFSAYCVAIPFCEEMIAMLSRHLSNSNSSMTDQLFLQKSLDRFANILSTLRDISYRQSHLILLKNLDLEKIQPRVYEEWEEKAEAALQQGVVLNQSVDIVNAINLNQLPLFQAATIGAPSSSPSLNCLAVNSLYSTNVLPACCMYLRQGMAFAAAEVLTNMGRDAVVELTDLADKSVNWHIAENAICFLGEVSCLPAVDAVSLFSAMSACLSECPCALEGFTSFLPTVGSDVSAFLDPVLKFYHRSQLEKSTLDYVVHSCGPVPFPFAWIKQLSAREKRQIQAVCQAMKSTVSSSISSLGNNADSGSEDLDLIVAKGDFLKFISYLKSNQQSLFDFLANEQDYLLKQHSRLHFSSFIGDKALHSVDLISLEFKSAVEPLFNALPPVKIAELVGCSTAPTYEHLSVRFVVNSSESLDNTTSGTTEPPSLSSSSSSYSQLLSNIATICCRRNYVNTFLCLFHNSSLQFADCIASVPDKPSWMDFFQSSKEFLLSNHSGSFDEKFVSNCIGFVSALSKVETGAADRSLIAEKLFMTFSRHLLAQQQSQLALGDSSNDGSDDSTAKRLLGQYSALLLALFQDPGVSDEKLEDSRLLYSILRSNMVFDVTKLFRFQSANYLATEEADECLAETFADDDFPPAFLRTSIAAVPIQTKLSSKLKRPEPVSFLGFGRPLRAILQHILLSGKYSSSVLSKVRHKIEEKVFNLALENAENAPIVASCILFLNMLGFSAERLQCAICVLRSLVANNNGQHSSPSTGGANSTITASPVPYSPVTFCKLAFSKMDRYASEIESICLSELSSINYDLYGSVATLAVLDRLRSMSSHNDVTLRPAWSRVLISLATSNNWLGFFTYAEVLRADPEDILQLASWFSDPHLKSHVIKTARGVATAVANATAAANAASVPVAPAASRQHRHHSRRRAGRRKPTKAVDKSTASGSDSDNSDGEELKSTSGRGRSPRDTTGAASRQHASAGSRSDFSSSLNKRMLKSSSVLLQRELDLLSVVLQVAAAKNEEMATPEQQSDDYNDNNNNNSNNEQRQFEQFIDAVYRSKNPVCAIYAACMPRADRLACLLAYFHCYFPDILVAMTTSSSATTTTTAEAQQLQRQLPATSNPSFGDSAILTTLATAIDHLSTKKAYKTLLDGFSILLPSCPLSKLFKAAVSLANQQSVDEFKFGLNQFTLAMEFYDSQLCPELNVEAIAAIAGQFLARLLYVTETISLFLVKILEIYCECRVADVVVWPLRLSPKQLLGLANQMVAAPDDGSQLTATGAAVPQQQVQPIARLLGDDVDSVNWSLIGELQSRSQYIRARLVGQLLGIPLADILLKEFRHRYSRIDTRSISALIDYWKTFLEARRQSMTMNISSDMLIGFLQSMLDDCCKSPLEFVFVAYEISRLSAANHGGGSFSNEVDYQQHNASSSIKTNVFMTFYCHLLQYYCDLVPAEGVATTTSGASTLPPSPAAMLFNEYFETSLTSAVMVNRGVSSSSHTTNRLLHCRYDVDQSSSTVAGKTVAGGQQQLLANLASSELGQLALRVLLDDLLQHGYVTDALLLNKMAGNRSNDLLIVKQCTDLVWGRMGVAELPPPYSACATVAQAMDRMAADCCNMKTHIDRLRLYHSIALECSLTYAEAETLPALTLCEHLLRRATYNALDLIGKLARSGDLLAPEDYAVLVCQHVLRVWATDFDVVSSAATDKPVGLDELANSLFQLCPDQTILGNQLIQGVNQLLAGPGRGFHELSAAVDILVHAHNAFGMTNNVEGIASALHLARTLSRELESGGDAHLQLLVKMLHQIGRYGEMSYLFDILYRNGKLPLVFQMRPRPDCEAQFRTSLLEFLRGVSTSGTPSSLSSSQQLTQPDLYRHVCLQYGMEREVAQLLFDSAVSQVADLGRLANSVDLNAWASEASNSLPIICQKFVDAAKGFARAECPSQADACIRQARLLALQLRFLSEGTVSTASAAAVQQQQQQFSSSTPTTTTSTATSLAAGASRQPNLLIIVGRTNSDQIREIIIQQTVAFECLIISEAYKIECWPEAVFRQVVLLPKNARYFHDLMAIYSLADRFFEELVDLAERFNSQQQQAGGSGLTAQQAGRLKRVLHYCPDYRMQYALAGRLSFHDLQIELINSQATPLIKDLIASNQLQQPSSARA